jgi:hypothetical protein
MSRHRALARVVALALTLTVAVAVPTTAAAGNSDGNHCIAPWGADLNEEWGVSEAIVWAFCTEVGAGQDWRVAAGWGVSTTFKKVPKGFVPAGETPLEDFLAKFVAYKVVIDPGTTKERVYTFTDPAGLLISVSDDGAGINGVTMGTLDPLSIGTHFVASYWVMSAMHCDGGGRSIEFNCLAAGDAYAFATEFDVTSGQ